MSKFTSLLSKIVLSVLLVGLVLTASPLGTASAAGLSDETPPSNERLEQAWARLQSVYTRQDERLDQADEFVARVQTLIEKANARSWDTSAVQAALDAFVAALPAAQAAHEPGAAIIASHAGFDENGKVTDRAAAVETARALREVLKNTHISMNNTGKALLEALRALREAHPRPQSEPNP
jgi:hypothetical protein